MKTQDEIRELLRDADEAKAAYEAKVAEAETLTSQAAMTKRGIGSYNVTEDQAFAAEDEAEALKATWRELMDTAHAEAKLAGMAN